MQRFGFSCAARLRAVLGALAVAAGVALPGCAGKPPAGPYTIDLALRSPVVIAAEGLHVELLAVDDKRCPVDVVCVWAGYAAVTIRVACCGIAPADLLIGTAAASTTGLPGPGRYGRFRFSLLDLQPPQRQSVPPGGLNYRALLRVSSD